MMIRMIASILSYIRELFKFLLPNKTIRSVNTTTAPKEEERNNHNKSTTKKKKNENSNNQDGDSAKIISDFCAARRRRSNNNSERRDERPPVNPESARIIANFFATGRLPDKSTVSNSNTENNRRREDDERPPINPESVKLLADFFAPTTTNGMTNCNPLLKNIHLRPVTDPRRPPGMFVMELTPPPPPMSRSAFEDFDDGVVLNILSYCDHYTLSKMPLLSQRFPPLVNFNMRQVAQEFLDGKYTKMDKYTSITTSSSSDKKKKKRTLKQMIQFRQGHDHGIDTLFIDFLRNFPDYFRRQRDMPASSNPYNDEDYMPTLQKAIKSHAAGLDLTDEVSFVDMCFNACHLQRMFCKDKDTTADGTTTTTTNSDSNDDATPSPEELARKRNFIHTSRDLLLRNGIVREGDFRAEGEEEEDDYSENPWKITFSCNEYVSDPREAMRLLHNHAIMEKLPCPDNNNNNNEKMMMKPHHENRQVHNLFFARHLAFCILQQILEHRQIKRRHVLYKSLGSTNSKNVREDENDFKYADIPIYTSCFQIEDYSQKRYTSLRTGFGLMFADDEGTPMEIYGYVDDYTE